MSAPESTSTNLTEIVKVAIYARVSSERQEREDTIASQIAQLKACAEKNGYKITADFIDNGYSGELLARPALDKLRDDAGKGIFTRVLINSPDRLARRYLYQEIVMEDLRNHGVQVEFLNRKIAETDEDRLLLGIQGLFSEYEKAKIRERVRRGRMHKAYSGFVVGGCAPYGYKYLPRVAGQMGRYEIDKEQARVVKIIFDAVANKGLSLHKVQRYLAEKQIKPPGRWGERQFWGRSTLNKIIRNTSYYGTTYYNKNIPVEPTFRKSTKYRRMKRTSNRLRPKNEWVPITIPAILDKELFDRAQRQVNANIALSGRNCRHEYLLRGLIRCGNCNSPYLGCPCHGVYYYRCIQRQRAYPLPRSCFMPQIKADRLDELIWKTIMAALNNPKLLTSQLPKLVETKTTEAKDLEQARIESAQHFERLKEEENRLLEAYATKVLTIDQLQDYMTKLKGRIQEAEKRMKSMHPAQTDEAPIDATNPEVMERFLKTLSEGIKVIEGDFVRKQRFIRLLVEKIILDKEGIRIKVFLPSDGLDPASFFCQFESTAIARCGHRWRRFQELALQRFVL
ncbi:MAG: hypothetical protein KCHDKBKB_01076 [Elusimicrobia bacterium]|nr:hypothetical protein [Elusimicrobiota bacterium]